MQTDEKIDFAVESSQDVDDEESEFMCSLHTKKKKKRNNLSSDDEDIVARHGEDTQIVSTPASSQKSTVSLHTVRNTAEHLEQSKPDQKQRLVCGKTSVSALKSKFSRKLNKDILKHHRTMHLFKQAEEEKYKQQLETEVAEASEPADLSAYENNIFDISSDLRKVTSKMPQLVKPPTTVKVRTTCLRRERIEKELTSSVKSNVRTMAVTKSKNQYTTAVFQNSILTWDPVWLEQGKDELDITTELQSVPYSFDYYDDYMRVFWPLLLLETWCHLRKDWDDQQYSPTVYIVDNVDQHKTIGKCCQLRCSYYEEDSSTKRKYLGCPSEDDLLILKFQSNGNEIKAFGIVEDIEKIWLSRTKTKGKPASGRKYGHYTLCIKLEQISNLKMFKSVSVTRITSLTNVFRKWNGMIGFQNSLLAKDILKPYRKKTYNLLEDKINRTPRLAKLNANQFQAASTVTRSVLSQFVIPRIFLLQGPPGTGKSYTLKTIVTHLLQVNICKYILI